MSRKVLRLWGLSFFLVMVWFTWRATDYHKLSSNVTSTTPEYSFLASLHAFLVKLSETPRTISRVLPASAENDGERFDRFAMRNGAVPPTLNVYVYEMPVKFTTDLLWLFQNSLEQTENLTSNGSPVHRLVQQEAMNWITAQPAWQRSSERDHVLPVHHPWLMKSHRRFLKAAIWLLPDLDSSGNWYDGSLYSLCCRYKEREVSLEKDVVMPYVANVRACDAPSLTISFPSRKTLLFFRGRIVRSSGGRIRAKLAAVLRDEKEGVVIQEGSIGAEGEAATQLGMRGSVFCLSPAGDTPSSARLFDAIESGCNPAVVSDELELPFEGILDNRQTALFVPAAQAFQKRWLVAHLRNITSHEVATMQQHLAQFARHFQYATPAQPLGPEDLIWRMVAGKLHSVRLHICRSQKLVQGALDICNCQCTRVNLSAPTIYNKLSFTNS